MGDADKFEGDDDTQWESHRKASKSKPTVIKWCCCWPCLCELQSCALIAALFGLCLNSILTMTFFLTASFSSSYSSSPWQRVITVVVTLIFLGVTGSYGCILFGVWQRRKWLFLPYLVHQIVFIVCILLWIASNFFFPDALISLWNGMWPDLAKTKETSGHVPVYFLLFILAKSVKDFAFSIIFCRAFLQLKRDEL